MTKTGRTPSPAEPGSPLAAFGRDQVSVRLGVRLTPRASRDSVGPFEILADGATVLAVHVRAVPEKGAANAALVALLAKRLGVAKSAVEVVSGHTSRLKSVRIAGDPDGLARAIVALVEA